MQVKSISMCYSDTFRERGTTLIFPLPRIGSKVMHDFLLMYHSIWKLRQHRVQTMQLTAPVNNTYRNWASTLSLCFNSQWWAYRSYTL